MGTAEAAEYLGMSVVGVCKAAREGRLACRMSGSGQRLFDREVLDAYLGRKPQTPAPKPRVEALYCRVSSSTGQESSLANQEAALRETADAKVFRGYRDRACGLRETRKGLNRMLDDAAAGKFTVVGVVWREAFGAVRGGLHREVSVTGGRHT